MGSRIKSRRAPPFHFEVILRAVSNPRGGIFSVGKVNLEVK